MRLVHAVGLFREHVAPDRVGAGARASADLAELADTALPLQISAVAQGDEQRRVAVQLGERMLANVAGGYRQKAAGKYFAQVGNEDETLAFVDAARGASNAVGAGGPEHFGHGRVGLAAAPGFRSLLQQEAAVMLRLGALDIELHPPRGLIQLFENLLEFFR